LKAIFRSESQPATVWAMTQYQNFCVPKLYFFQLITNKKTADSRAEASSQN
jgi:hypothetical protein